MVDACCGTKLVRVLRKLGFRAQYYRELRSEHWPSSSDKHVLDACRKNEAVLVTKDKRLAQTAREAHEDVIELRDSYGVIEPVEEAYIVLNKLGHPIHQLMLTTKLHFGMIWNLESGWR